MSQIFNQIEVKGVGSNIFNLSHDKKLSCNMGELIPTLIIDTVPGDHFRINSSQLVRFAPLVAPIMHQINVYQHYFFVPYRLLWDNWEDFITGGEDGLDASVFPTIAMPAIEKNVGTLADYMGYPPDAGASGTQNISALPFAAYQLIYNEYFRDQNLQNKADITLVDGDNPNPVRDVLLALRGRAWQHDYFTSALPWTQKGIEATIPLGGSANVIYEQNMAGQILRLQDGTILPINGSTRNVEVLGNAQSLSVSGVGSVNVDVADQLKVDLTTATAASINDLRRAFRLQEWLEKNARGGSRYVESILSHFGVKSSDARLQRPEYLGGGSSPVSISEVLQTSATGDYADTPQGTMAGHGINAGSNGSISKFTEEHGYIIGIMSVLPRASYWQGIPKHLTKFDKFDYYWPSFANLGEQPIQNKELYLDSSLPNMEETFGYIPRYAEYKYINSTVHGEFRTSQDFWHMGRKFTSQPNLNAAFIKSDPTTRIFAVETPDVDQLYCHIYNQVKASRKMPVFGTPTI